MKHIRTFELFLNESYSISDKKVLTEGFSTEPSFDEKTGLIYYFDVPFTKEDVEEILDAMKAMLKSKYTANDQFEVKPMISIKDKANGAEHNFSPVDIQILAQYYVRVKDKVTSRKDFK